MSEPDPELRTNHQDYYGVASGVAVFAGAAGSLLLLLRKEAAYYLFIASLIGAMVTLVHTIAVMAQSPGDYGALRVFGYVVMPLLVAAFLIGYAKNTRTRNWID